MSRGYYGSLGIIALLLQSTSVGAFIAAAPGARAASCCVVQQGAGEFGQSASFALEAFLAANLQFA
jgi:hypothetical protein